MVEPATWQIKEIPNEAKKSPCNEASQVLNRAPKKYTEWGKQLFEFINYRTQRFYIYIAFPLSWDDKSNKPVRHFRNTCARWDKMENSWNLNKGTQWSRMRIHYRSFFKAMNISFYPDARMHFWNVELAYYLTVNWLKSLTLQTWKIMIANHAYTTFTCSQSLP